MHNYRKLRYLFLSSISDVTSFRNVRHPNIVQFLGLCKHKNVQEKREDIFFVTEFMDNGDLFDALFFGDAPMSWKVKAKIALGIFI